MRASVSLLTGLLVVSGAAADAAAQTPDDPDVVAAVAAARTASVVLIGETRDNPVHLENQVAIVAALKPAAIVFERIPQAAEEKVNRLRDEGAAPQTIGEALGWGDGHHADVATYERILAAAPEARVFGAGQPEIAVRQARSDGAAEAFGPDAATYGLDRPLDPLDEVSRERALSEAHCGLAPDERSGMVEAQRFRDAAIADAALWARTMTGDGQVVVIASSANVDRVRGVPAALAIAEPGLSVFAIGQVESAGPGAAGAPDGIFDATLRAPASTDRPQDDGCAHLPVAGR